jgi:hypothetical protein
MALVAIEAKKLGACAQALPQLVAYLGALQHARKKAKKLVTNVYGIATDSNAWIFVRLDDKLHLQISRAYQSPFDHKIIYKWIDSIITAAVHSTPHTTPTKTRRVPIDNQSFERNIEHPIFSLASPIPTIERFLQGARDDEVYEILQDENGQPVLSPCTVHSHLMNPANQSTNSALDEDFSYICSPLPAFEEER